MTFFSNPKGLKGSVGEPGAFSSDEDEIEMIYCPEISAEHTKPNLPKRTCQYRQDDKNQPLCYGGCKSKGIKEFIPHKNQVSKLRPKILAYKKKHPEANAKDIAKALGCSFNVAQSYLKGR